LYVSVQINLIGGGASSSIASCSKSAEHESIRKQRYSAGNAISDMKNQHDKSSSSNSIKEIKELSKRITSIASEAENTIHNQANIINDLEKSWILLLSSTLFYVC
jgi:seryl-tRNA synthetase